MLVCDTCRKPIQSTLDGKLYWNPKARIAQFAHGTCKQPNGVFPFNIALVDLFHKQFGYTYGVATLDASVRSADEQAAWSLYEKFATEEWARSGFSRKKWAEFGFEPKPGVIPAVAGKYNWEAYMPSQVQKSVLQPPPPPESPAPRPDVEEIVTNGRTHLWYHTRRLQNGLCKRCKGLLADNPTTDGMGRLRPSLYTSKAGNAIACRDCDPTFRFEWGAGQHR